jgi:hypothetical protein
VLPHQIFVLLVDDLRLVLDLFLVVKMSGGFHDLCDCHHTVRILIEVVLGSFLVLVLYVLKSLALSKLRRHRSFDYRAFVDAIIILSEIVKTPYTGLVVL